LLYCSRRLIMTKVVITIRKPKFAKIRHAATVIKDRFPVKVIIEKTEDPVVIEAGVRPYPE